jgi:hypothetical protein
MAATRMDPVTVALDRFGHSVEYTYKVLSEICGVPASTVGHRNRGRMSIQQRATNQQYLGPYELPDISPCVQGIQNHDQLLISCRPPTMPN